MSFHSDSENLVTRGRTVSGLSHVFTADRSSEYISCASIEVISEWGRGGIGVRVQTLLRIIGASRVSWSYGEGRILTEAEKFQLSIPISSRMSIQNT